MTAILRAVRGGVQSARCGTGSRVGLLTMLVLLAVFAAGCKKRIKSEPPGPRINKVEISGNSELSKDEIVEHINLRPSKTFGEKNYYVDGLEVIDEERIEQLYVAHGHYDAKVQSIDVEVTKQKRKVKKQRAKVKIAVTEGPGTTISRVDWTFADAIDHGEPVDRKAVIAEAGLRQGDKFTIPALNEAAALAQLSLRQQGYPDAVVRERAEVNRDQRRADVAFEVVPGEHFRITGYELEGLERVREDLVRREIGDVSGREYSPVLLEQVENSAYGTGAFSTVTVVDAKRHENGTMTLAVRVRERQMQEVGFGVMLEVDPIQWSQRAGVRYRHHNLFRNLTDFETSLLAGWAELPNPFQMQANGPRAELRLKFTKKGFLERKLVWTAEPRIAVDIREGYQLWGVKNRLGVSRFFKKVFWFGLSYNNRFADFFNFEGLQEQAAALGIEFNDPYISSYLELETILFRLDDFTNPNRGVRLGVDYQFANRYLGSQFDYHQVQPELRGYIDPHPRLRLAARARVGFILPYADTLSAPIDLRLYQGGANDARGWPLRRLSPRVTLCDEEECIVVPIGGNSEFLGNLEMRIKLVKALWLALYGDIGDVRTEIFTVRPSGWMYSTGTGIRYETPVGPIRLDFAVRINEDERFPEPLRFGFHFSLGEAF